MNENGNFLQFFADVLGYLDDIKWVAFRIALYLGISASIMLYMRG